MCSTPENLSSQMYLSIFVYDKYNYKNFLLGAPDPTTMKVFGMLMTKQEFINGARTTKQAAANELDISYRSIIKAFN